MLFSFFGNGNAVDPDPIYKVSYEQFFIKLQNQAEKLQLISAKLRTKKNMSKDLRINR